MTLNGSVRSRQKPDPGIQAHTQIDFLKINFDVIFHLSLKPHKF